MTYHKFDLCKIDEYSNRSIERMYNSGYLFTRVSRGSMIQTISLRINLNNFTFNSENRRVLRKTNWLCKSIIKLPLDIANFDFSILKLGKDFYKYKNQKKVFSANKIKMLLTNKNESNFNILFKYKSKETVIGYAISLETSRLLHYAYPFYDLIIEKQNIGMGMILKSIEYSLHKNKSYYYIGSVTTEKALYKLQFNNLEWWDGTTWDTDLQRLKDTVARLPSNV